MRQYEPGDLICVNMATARPLPQPARDQPTAAVLSAEEQRHEGWLPGVIRSATNDGLADSPVAADGTIGQWDEQDTTRQ